MISYKKSLEILKKNTIKLKSESIFSKYSVNRVCAKNLISPNDYPAENNTAFDGFAINSKDTLKLNKKKTKKFKILKTIAAGDNPNINNVPRFSVVEVMTGAIIKKPFDAVIPIEKINFFPNKKKPKYIIINKKIRKNQYIRFKGSDYKKGEKVINKGQIIKPSHVLAFMTLGVKKVRVKKKTQDSILYHW